jgi:hypothetical protein
VACSHRLTTRKRGEGVKHSRSPKRLHRQSCPKPGIPLTRDRVLRASVFCDYSGAYYSKTGSVRKTVSPRAPFTKSRLCGFCFETHLDSLLLTTRKWGGWEHRTRCVTAPQYLTTRKWGVRVIEEVRRSSLSSNRYNSTTEGDRFRRRYLTHPEDTVL